MEKAVWVNHQYLKTADPAIVAQELEWHLRKMNVDPTKGPKLEDVIVAQRERTKTLVEMAEKSAFFYAELQGYNEKDAAKHLDANGVAALGELTVKLTALTDWSMPNLHETVNGFAAEKGLGLGKIAQPIRVAVAGMAISPPIDQTLALLGRERTLARLHAAVEFAKNKH
jgi:glutamyl-tRNA synthetase